MFDKLLNKKIISCRAIKPQTENYEEDKFEIVFEDGYIQLFLVEGDCCSRSWIEHLTLPNDLKGATLISIEDQTIDRQEDGKEFECLQVYETRFKTDRGDVVLEYRNSSNGYYGGSLRPVDQNGAIIYNL